MKKLFYLLGFRCEILWEYHATSRLRLTNCDYGISIQQTTVTGNRIK